MNYSPKNATRINMAATKYVTNGLWGMTPTPPQLWKSIRSRDIPKNIRNFLWKCLHNSHKIGSYWTNIPSFMKTEESAACVEKPSPCNTSWLTVNLQPSDEPCGTPGEWIVAQKRRRLAGHLLRINPWRKPTKLHNTKNSKKKGRNRLFTILMLELAYMIWKIRCTWIVDNEGELPTKDEIHNRWVKNINEAQIRQTRNGYEEIWQPGHPLGTTSMNIFYALCLSFWVKAPFNPRASN